MRLARRSQLLFLPLVLSLFLCLPVTAAHAQSAAQSSTQSSAQAGAQIPPAWNDAVARLASRIGNLAGSQKSISMSVKNISSLGDADVAAISQAIQSELTRLGLGLSADSSAGALVTVTLSQGADGYVWVARVSAGAVEQTTMVSAPTTERARNAGANGKIVLERKLIWQQETRFLDFFVQTAPVYLASTAVVLEPHQLVFYRFSDARNWDASQKVPVPDPERPTRDLFGRIDEQGGSAYLGPASPIFHSSVRCTGGFDDPQRVQCTRLSDVSLVSMAHPLVSGHEESETAKLTDRCGDASVVLSTGNGDWTQPDTLQGYLLSDLRAAAASSSSEINFDGPVLALHAQKEGGARAVVHNLKTGNYEGYIVTATCGR